MAFNFSDALQPVYENFGVIFPEANVESYFELPIPATYFIDRDGFIKLAYINANHASRLEPEKIITALESLGCLFLTLLR